MAMVPREGRGGGCGGVAVTACIRGCSSVTMAAALLETRGRHGGRGRELGAVTWPRVLAARGRGVGDEAPRPRAAAGPYRDPLSPRYAMKCLDKKRIKMKQGETLALNERIMLSLVSTGVRALGRGSGLAPWPQVEAARGVLLGTVSTA